MNFRAILPFALLVIAAGIHTGCSQHGSDSANSADPIVVRRGNGGDAQILDPARAEDVHSFNVLTDLYEGLVTIDASGKIVPGVARRWDVSDNGLVYTFELAEDAAWSDGTPVTAENFVAGFQRTLSPDTASAYAYLLYPIRNAQEVVSGDMPLTALGVEALGEHKLAIELHARAPYFLSVLTLPIAFPAAHEANIGEERFSSPDRFVGNGPFVLNEWHRGSHIGLRKNPRFRDAESVVVDEVSYVATVQAAAELNMYRAGELDITFTVPGSHVSLLRESRPDELRIAPSLWLYYLAFDLSEAPFDDHSLRQALSMAIDREAIVRVPGRGEQPAYGLIPEGVANYQPARFAWTSWSADERLAAARALYEQAGYSDENPLRITLLYDTCDIHERMAVAVSAMWREALGVEVVLDMREWKYFLATRANRDEWQVMRFAWSGDFDHPATFTDIFRSDSPQNLPGYSSRHYDRLLAEAESASDSRLQMQLYAAAEAAMLADNPIIPLYFYVSKHLVSPEVSGFETNALDRHPSRYLRITGTAAR